MLGSLSILSMESLGMGVNFHITYSVPKFLENNGVCIYSIFGAVTLHCTVALSCSSFGLVYETEHRLIAAQHIVHLFGQAGQAVQ
jgi:hypothetical protein